MPLEVEGAGASTVGPGTVEVPPSDFEKYSFGAPSPAVNFSSKVTVKDVESGISGSRGGAFGVGCEVGGTGEAFDDRRRQYESMANCASGFSLARSSLRLV